MECKNYNQVTVLVVLQFNVDTNEVVYKNAADKFGCLQPDGSGRFWVIT